MPSAIDITGQRFGKLIALSKAPSRNGKTYWLCQCDCGNQKEIQTCALRDGRTKSCGCENHPKSNNGQKVVDFRVRIKKALVEANGHKCACCGLADDSIVYDFHHVDPSTKQFGIGNGSTTRSKQAYVNEAKKCVMLCANCHRKVENGLIPNNFQIIFDEEKFYDVIEKIKRGEI